MSDPGTSYRTRAEIQEVRQNRDPITSFREKILSAELASADELKVSHWGPALPAPAAPPPSLCLRLSPGPGRQPELSRFRPPHNGH